MRALTATMLVLATALAGCGGGGDGVEPIETEPCTLPATLPPATVNPTVTFRTTMGDIVAEVYLNEVPVTAQNFLDLARDGFYDGTRFHRIITDFMMQGGDPNSKDSDPGNDGQGGPGHEIQDEFHHALRHSGKGVLSMANSGPNTGGSQFFITFKATPWLDDRHAVFGRVLSGHAVLDKVNAEAATEDGAPLTTVTLTSVSVQDGEAADSEPSLGFWSPDTQQRVPEEGGRTHFVAVLANPSSRPLPVCVTATAPDGAQAGIELGKASLTVPAGQRVALLVEARLGPDAPAATQVNVTARTVGSQSVLPLYVGRTEGVGPATVETGDTIEGHYIGLTVDGRVFDTSIQSLAEEVARSRTTTDAGRAYASFNLRSSYDTFSFQSGGAVIQGFTDLANGIPEHGQDASRVPAAKAYGEGCAGGAQCHQLAGRDLLFQLDVVDIQ